jgi:hypothetical protein
VELSIRPVPEEGERRALDAALRRLAPDLGSGADAYRSRWRTAGLPARVLLPPWPVGFERKSPGASRA